MKAVNPLSIIQSHKLKKFSVAFVCLLVVHLSFSPTNLSRRLEVEDLRILVRDEEVDFKIQRQLVRNLGGGNCQWTDPHDVDQNPYAELFATAIVAYPGAGKRIAFLQIEALTELATKDDFYLDPVDISMKYAFFKTQYPHHEGIWSWGNKCGQSIFLLTEPKFALTSYLFILHEIKYAKYWDDAYANLYRVMTINSPIESWELFRDHRFSSEIHFWSWFIDYWMEGGILRDIYTHEYTTPEHYSRLRAPDVYTEPELRTWQANINLTEPVYDTHCNGGDMNDCSPTAIASYERMMDPVIGPAEVAKFTAVIENKAGITIVEEEARECAWRKVVIEKKSGRRDQRDRVGPDLDKYIFRPNEEQIIKGELLRIRDKYSSAEWQSNSVAQELVGYMNEYLVAYEHI